MPGVLTSDVGLFPFTGTSHNWLLDPDPVTTSRWSSPNQVRAVSGGRLGPSRVVGVSKKPFLSCRIAASCKRVLVPARTIIATRLPSGATRNALIWSAPDGGGTVTAGVCPLRSTQTPGLCPVMPVTQRSPRLSQLSEVNEVPVSWVPLSCPSVFRPSGEVVSLPVYSTFADPP